MTHVKTITLCKLIAVAFLSIGCSRGSVVKMASSGEGKLPPPVPPQTVIKEKLLQNIKSTSDVVRLSIERLVQKGEGAAFVYPASLAFSGRGGVYISDNNGHAIYYSPSGELAATPWPAQSGIGKPHFPNTIQEWQDQILVSDNDGVKIYDQEGSFKRLLRTYYGINHFIVSDDGNIYANTLHNNPKPSDPLIVELSRDGTKIKGFGERLNRSPNNDAINKAYLATSGGLLIAALKHRPIVQIYNRGGGKILREIKLNHPIFSELERQLGGTSLPKYTAGVSISGEKIFVLLDLPRPEVVEFDLQGQEKSRYLVSGTPTIIDYFGFDAREVESQPVFAIGIIDPQWQPALVETAELRKQRAFSKGGSYEKG